MNTLLTVTPREALPLLERAGAAAVGAESPLVFGQGGTGGVIAVGERSADPRSACSILVRELLTPQGSVRVGLIGSVATDPAWQGGNYSEQPRGFLNIMPMFDMLVQNPAAFEGSVRTYEDADEYLAEVDEETLEEDDANNILYRFEASSDYDPEPEVGKIEAPLLAILFADDELNPPETGTMERVMPRVPRGRWVLVPAKEGSYGHRNQVRAAFWRDELGAFLKSLEKGGP